MWITRPTSRVERGPSDSPVIRLHSKLTGDLRDARRADADRGQRRSNRPFRARPSRREIDGADIHPLGDRLVDQVDDELAGVADVALGILVAVARPPVAGLMPSTTTGGTELTALKKLNGAALTRPDASTVVASAIGRGTTVLTSKLVGVGRRDLAPDQNAFTYSCIDCAERDNAYRLGPQLTESRSRLGSDRSVLKKRAMYPGWRSGPPVREFRAPAFVLTLRIGCSTA